MFNVLVGGAAGDGIETMTGLFEKILKRKGFYLFSMRDFMSRVRGGHNFTKLRFGAKPVYAHRDKLDGLVVFNQESFELHRDELSKDGFVLHDEGVGVKYKNAVSIGMARLAKEAGNPKTIGTVGIGAMLKLFGLGLESADEVLRENLPEKVLDANFKALRLGYEAVEARFGGNADARNKTGKTATSKTAETKGKAETKSETDAKNDGSDAETIADVQAEVPAQTKKAATDTMLLTGAEAMALGALAGGLKFYSAYPMSPATTLLEYFQRHGEAFRVAVEQAEDEIAAVNMALGAAYAGAPAMAGTSGGGFALMVEALGFAGIAELPVVLANVMRPGPATGLPTRTEQSDLRFVIHSAPGEFPRMVIAVRDHADAFTQTARAFRLAWQYQVPVILLSDQYLADAAATIPPLDAARAKAAAALPPGAIETGAPKGEYLRYAVTKSGVSPLRIPGKSAALVRVDSDEHTELGVITEGAAVRVAQADKRARKMQLLAAEAREPDYHGPKRPELLLVGFATTAPALAEAVARLNKNSKVKTGALCFGDIWPLPTKRLRELATTAKRVVNVEQNATGQLASLLRSEAMIACDASILKYDGRQMSVDDILRGVEGLDASGAGSKRAESDRKKSKRPKPKQKKQGKG